MSNALPCMWFAACVRPAAGLVRHPIIGNVPTCTHCAERHELNLQPL